MNICQFYIYMLGLKTTDWLLLSAGVVKRAFEFSAEAANAIVAS